MGVYRGEAHYLAQILEDKKHHKSLHATDAHQNRINELGLFAGRRDRVSVS